MVRPRAFTLYSPGQYSPGTSPTRASTPSRRSAAEDLLNELDAQLGNGGEPARAARQVAGAIRETVDRAAEEGTESTDYDALVGMLLDGRGGAESSPGGGAGQAAAGIECAAPVQRNSPALVYPRRARGSADLRFSVDLDRRGVPVTYELNEMQIDSRRHERAFRRSAEEYIGKLRFDLRQDGNCTGGRTARVRVQFR